MRQKEVDMSTRVAAGILAENVRSFWYSMGFVPPRIHVYKVRDLGTNKVFYGLRSDMVNGFPRKRRH
jgi:hypothetical protein